MKQQKEVVCDSSSIIAISEVCLLSLVSEFAKRGVKFYIPVGVRKEVVDTPITTKSFRLEAVRIASAIARGDISVIDKEELAQATHDKANLVMSLANSLFSCNGRPIHLIDYGECDAIALALEIGCGTLMVDEKTTRLLIENPQALHDSLETRIGRPVSTNHESLGKLSDLLAPLSAIRSSELVAVGFSEGILASLYKDQAGRDVLFGALYAVKENGCSIGEVEVREYLDLLSGPEKL